MEIVIFTSLFFLSLCHTKATFFGCITNSLLNTTISLVIATFLFAFFSLSLLISHFLASFPWRKFVGCPNFNIFNVDMISLSFEHLYRRLRKFLVFESRFADDGTSYILKVTQSSHFTSHKKRTKIDDGKKLTNENYGFFSFFSACFENEVIQCVMLI